MIFKVIHKHKNMEIPEVIVGLEAIRSIVTNEKRRFALSDFESNQYMFMVLLIGFQRYNQGSIKR